MGYVQIRQPDTSAVEAPGWCLGMATKVFFGPEGGYACAKDAWNASPTQNGSRDMPGVSVPVWFSWVGDLGYGAYDYGHVVVWVPGRGFLSSPGRWTDPVGQQWFGSIQEIENWFGCRYLGFTLDIMPNGTVAEWTNEPTPEPAPAPAPSPSGNTYIVFEGDNLWGIAEKFYGTANWDNVMGIANANGIENPNLIFPGQILTIPGV